MLTKQERKVLLGVAGGLPAEEIADKIGIAPNTAKKHLDNIKKKVGWSKATELSGYAICEFLGVDYYEIRQKILSSILLVVFMFTIPNIDIQAIRRPGRTRGRRNETEYLMAA